MVIRSESGSVTPSRTSAATCSLEWCMRSCASGSSIASAGARASSAVNVPAMAEGVGSRSGRESRVDTSVYTAARTASEAIQTRAGWRVARCILRRLSVDGAHDLLVLEHLLRIPCVDDLAAVD